jgi:predicted permease
VYRLALRLSPNSFARFRTAAEADFEQVARRERERKGRIAVMTALVRALADLVVRAPGEWRRRRTRREGAMATWARETVAAGRALARRPFFSTIVLVTLALGIGATVTIFTIVDAILIRPLPYPESERIVTFSHHAPGLDLPELRNSGGMVRFYRENARSIRDLSVVDGGPANLTGGDVAEQVEMAWVSPSLFDALRVRPALGRAFTPEEETPESPRVAILTHHGWVERFGADPGVLGRTLEIDGEPHEIVGVMPEGFAYPRPGTVALLPYWLAPDAPFGTFGLGVVARLAPGVDFEQALGEIEGLQDRVPEFFESLTPEFLEMAQWDVTFETLRDRTVQDVRTALWVVLGTVGFVLLIACANVANLFLVRAETRRREVAIRAAMGAGRGRLALGYLSESLVLGLAAGLVGLGLATVGVKVLVAAGPEELPRLHEVGVGLRTVLFTLGVSVAAALAFGSLPVARYLGSSFAGVLRQGGRGATEGRERHRVRNVLVATQLAFALVLLVGSGLMLRSFEKLRSVDPGVDPEGVLVVGLAAGEQRDRNEAAAFYQRMIEESRALPGVVEVGAANSVPMLAAGMNGGSFNIESRPRADDELPPVAMNAVVAGDAFSGLGIPLLRGRGVLPIDHEGGPAVAWVNESFVRTFLPDADPLTERLAFNDSGPYMAIAGVVGDTRHLGLDEPVRPMIYVPMTGPGESRGELGTMLLVLETDLDRPLSLVSAVRRLAARVDGTVPVTEARTMDRIVADSMADTSFTLVLLGIAAGVALVLGAVGIYGVIAYVVSQRTREIGVRMALGAEPAAVRRMVVRQGMAVAALGIVVGLGGAFGLTRLMRSLLFEVSATDPLTFGAVTAALAGVAALASYLPARRASRVDPVVALVEE